MIKPKTQAHYSGWALYDEIWEKMKPLPLSTPGREHLRCSAMKRLYRLGLKDAPLFDIEKAIAEIEKLQTYYEDVPLWKKLLFLRFIFRVMRFGLLGSVSKRYAQKQAEHYAGTLMKSPADLNLDQKKDLLRYEAFTSLAVHPYSPVTMDALKELHQYYKNNAN